MSNNTEITSFKNEVIVGDTTQALGITATNGGVGYKVLFNAVTPLLSSVTTVSATHNGIEHELIIDDAYDGATIAIIDTNRLSAFIDLDLTQNVQTVLSVGNEAVSPTLRRLVHLGYV